MPIIDISLSVSGATTSVDKVIRSVAKCSPNKIEDCNNSRRYTWHAKSVKAAVVIQERLTTAGYLETQIKGSDEIVLPTKIVVRTPSQPRPKIAYAAPVLVRPRGPLAAKIPDDPNATVFDPILELGILVGDTTRIDC